MVWFEQYSVQLVGYIEGIPCALILDAYGNLNGIEYRGFFIPINPMEE